MSTCRSCHRPILWAETEHGKRMPLDADPAEAAATDRGLFVLRNVGGAGATTYPVALAAVEGTIVEGEPVYVSHFSTCPHADEWRRS